MNDIVAFNFSDDGKSFEDLGKPNGIRCWLESDLRQVLDYQTPASFRKVVHRAKVACLTLNIETEDNFVLLPTGEYKFTRFACYLIAMNGDNKKPQVAAAQLYFATIAATFQSHIEHTESIDRVLSRQELIDGNKTLSSTAKRHGVQNYAFFQDAGYRGLYNMNLATLVRYKGVDKTKFLDRMSKAELAANLFRVTQTEEKIKNEQLRGQAPLERAALEVGRRVRSIMETPPEDLPLAEPLGEVKKKIKGTNKKFKKIDGPK